MLRILSSSALSLLLLLTLGWGGCISCPQFFMFSAANTAAASKAATSCCRKGSCERRAPSIPRNDCKRMPLELQASVQINLHAAEMPAVIWDAGQLGISAIGAMASTPAGEPAAEHSPPDLLALHSSFLI